MCYSSPTNAEKNQPAITHVRWRTSRLGGEFCGLSFNNRFSMYCITNLMVKIFSWGLYQRATSVCHPYNIGSMPLHFSLDILKADIYYSYIRVYNASTSTNSELSGIELRQTRRHYSYRKHSPNERMTYVELKKEFNSIRVINFFSNLLDISECMEKNRKGCQHKQWGILQNCINFHVNRCRADWRYC